MTVAPAPELLVVNKIDAAGDLALAQLRRALPDAVFVSAHTGDGLDKLRQRMGELVAPTDTMVDVTIPYDRGDLVARVHADGRVDATEHTARGHADQGAGAGSVGRQPARVRDVLGFSRRDCNYAGLLDFPCITTVSRRRRPETRVQPSLVGRVALSGHRAGAPALVTVSRCGPDR